MTLVPNTPITQENVGLLKAGDWLLRIHDGAMAQYCGLAVFHPDDAPRVSYTIGGHIQGNAPFHAFRYIGPDLGDGWIGWGGGECPVDGEASIDWQQRWVKGVYSGPAKLAPWKAVSAFRPALAKPDEGEWGDIETAPTDGKKTEYRAADGSITEAYANPEFRPQSRALYTHWRRVPTPPSVDWSVVGPKLVEALEEISRNRATKLPGDEWAETYIGGHCAASEKYADIADAALAATQPQSNGD